MGWFDWLKVRILSEQAPLSLESLSLRSSNSAYRPQRLHWTPEEVDALLTAEKHSHFCYATCPGHSATMQSVVLGFDLSSEQILLDQFFPTPASGLTDQILTVTLPTTAGTLSLDIDIKEKIVFAGSAALVANIQRKSLHKDQHQLRQVVFDKKHAPAIELLLPMTPLMSGHIVNLSEHALLMSCPARERPNLFTHDGECKIVLNDQVTFKARVRIKQVHFNRKPFRHNMVRLIFRDLSADQLEQLREFITQLGAVNGDVHWAA